MQLVLLILLIPFCSISFFIYLNALMNYAFNNVLNIPFFSGGLVLSLILGFASLSLFSNARTLSSSKLNFEAKVIPYFSYYSFILLVLFGISLIVNNVQNEINYLVLLVGILIVLFYLYITFCYMFKSEKRVLVLSSIDDYYKIDKEMNKEIKNTEEVTDNEKKEEIDENKSRESQIKCLTFELDDGDYLEYYIEDGEYFLEHSYNIKYNPKLKIVKKVLGEVKVIK